MNIDEDTCEWLGCPTPLEMYQHQCALLEDELIAAQKRLTEARRNIAGLVQMCDLLATGKATAEAELKKALDSKNQARRWLARLESIYDFGHLLQTIKCGRNHAFV